MKVYGTEWNAMLDLVLNALAEDSSPLASNLLDYLKTHLAPPNTYDDIEVGADVVRLIQHIAPATTLTEQELGYIQDECNRILHEGKE